MTKKDYEKIAKAIADCKPPQMADTGYAEGANNKWAQIAHKMADMLAQDNPRFDRERFLAACGVR